MPAKIGVIVLENIRRGRLDVAEGKTESAEDVIEDIQSW